MGMFDDVYCEAELPAGHPDDKRTFQTKSLFCCLHDYTISKEGRLILHSALLERADEEENTLPRSGRVPDGDIDTEFHGDIQLTCMVHGELIKYGVRFTHGQLEWIRPWSEIPESQRGYMFRNDRG